MISRTSFPRVLFALTVAGLLVPAFAASSPAPVANAPATAWVPVGPDGGDARAFAGDPANSRHLYLGTTNSWIYESQDGGASWHRLAKLSKKDDLILDNIVVDEADPKTIYVGGWVVDHPDGGIFISHDVGQSWTQAAAMAGQSVRALAQAYSKPKVLVAGALKGVFESDDGGVAWRLITPPDSNELHEVESIAIDRVDPRTIYAGTWHLPWKTTDGGANWHNIKNGLIDDSDVFSIIIDPKFPSILYTSACSGIYKSLDGGEQYQKIQGIPATARRTRVLMQDPTNQSIVYAGTTEGLYRTKTAGTNWSRLTGPDVIVNDVYVDPKDDRHVLLATDRGGVLLSNDQAATFTAANGGFSQRQVSALLADVKDPQEIYAGVVNDKTYGGVFASSDGGRTWTQRSAGLDGHDVFSMAQAPEGTLLVGTGHGIYRWESGTWTPDGKVVEREVKTVAAVRKGKRVEDTKTIEKPGEPIDARVNSLDLSGSLWYAATSNGIYASDNGGATWHAAIAAPPKLAEAKAAKQKRTKAEEAEHFEAERQTAAKTSELAHAGYLTVRASGPLVLASSRGALAISQDGGQTWLSLALPSPLTAANTVAITPAGSLWIGGPQGVFFSEDKGASWTQIKTLPIANINNLSYDSDLGRILATSWNSTLVLAIDEHTRDYKWWDAGWTVRGAGSLGGRLMGASLYNGVVVQPQSPGASSAGGR